MRGVRASGSSRRLPKVSVLSNVCGSGDQGQESRFGTRSGNCARSWIAGRRPTAKRTFIGGYEFSWSCSATAPLFCKSYSLSTRCPRVSCRSCPPHILRGHIESQHEPVGALKLKSPFAFTIGLNLIGHHHEPVIARSTPVTDIFQYR